MNATPPSMAFEPRQTSVGGNIRQLTERCRLACEQWLETEREQLALWAPVAFGAGIAAWFTLSNSLEWLAFLCISLGVASATLPLPGGGRLGRSIGMIGLLAFAGCVLIWGKAVLIGAPPLTRAVFAEVTGEVVELRAVPAQQMSRVLLRPIELPSLPRLIRVNIATDDVPQRAERGAVLRFRVRLMPPAPPSLPGAYDFARRAYFQGIGATGRALAPILVLRPSTEEPALRARLFVHVIDRTQGAGAGIAAALATGDQGAISDEDAEAMRRSGLAHLLSISGLHVTALIGAVIFLLMRVMALSRRAALNWPLMLIAAGGGALAGIGYTLLTGAEVPTVRSCVAALLVLGGLALGRDAITLRLVAAGALLILLLWPEALVGPSFQMSFAAIMAIVALGEHPRFRAFAASRDEAVFFRLSRRVGVALLTGFAVELVLAPIALFHFHKAGLLGAFANLVAIPLTTFVVMPFEALALLLDVVGLGAPFWWLTAKALDLLLLIAHAVAASPWATMTNPSLSATAFGVIVFGGLWCLLWRSGWRWAGLAPVFVGVAAAGMAPLPDVLITGDGRHVVVRAADGRLAMLRAGAGTYVREMMAESAGEESVSTTIADLPEARCSRDLCAVNLKGSDRQWRLLIARSRDLVARDALEKDCSNADIVIADRRLPFWCRPRWIKADRRLLAATGGLAISFDDRVVRRARSPGDAHPWIIGPPPRRAGNSVVAPQ